jgi:hypothetical protein
MAKIVMMAFLASVFYVIGTQEDSSSNLDSSDTMIYSLYSHWKKDFNKYYGTEEDEQRFLIFKENHDYIHTKNDALETIQLSLNQFADQTDEEHQALNLGYKSPILERNEIVLPKSKHFYLGEIPESWDWRDHKAVSEVKN